MKRFAILFLATAFLSGTMALPVFGQDKDSGTTKKEKKKRKRKKKKAEDKSAA
jgi:hypothetical protein